jgi:hypothetical protein
VSQDVSIEDQVGMCNGQLVLTRLLINAAVGSHASDEHENGVVYYESKIETGDEGVFTAHSCKSQLHTVFPEVYEIAPPRIRLLC